VAAVSTEPSANTRTPTTWALSAALGLALLWGGNSVTIKIGVGALPPLLFLTVRSALGLIFIFVWARIAKIRLWPAKGQVWRLIGFSLLFSVQTLTLVGGTGLTLAAHSTVIMNAFPFFTALFAHFLIRGDRLSWRTSAGSLLALAGVAFTVLSGVGGRAAGSVQAPALLLGDVILLASAALLGLRTVISKRLMERIPPEQLLAWALLFSVPVTGVAALAVGGQPQQPFGVTHLVATLYTGLVISGFGFVALQGLLHKYRASHLTTAFLATPLFGVLLSWWLLDEALSWSLAGGAALVAAGIYLVNSRRQAAPRA
jgi:drug/metabolite transporter (DMT)-like permease